MTKKLSLHEVLLGFGNAVSYIESVIGDAGEWYLGPAIDEQNCFIGVESKNKFSTEQIEKLGLDISDIYATYKELNENYWIDIVSIFIFYSFKRVKNNINCYNN
jgi:hypothetical protein